MADSIDILILNPGDRKQIYQELGDEFSAIEPPVFAGLFATFLRQKGCSVTIYDAPAMMASTDEVARVATEDYSANLIVIVVYGLQPSASTQNMTAAGDIARKIKDAGVGAKIMIWISTFIFACLFFSGTSIKYATFTGFGFIERFPFFHKNTNIRTFCVTSRIIR